MRHQSDRAVYGDLLLYVINMGIAEVLQATGNVLLPGLWMAL